MKKVVLISIAVLLFGMDFYSYEKKASQESDFVIAKKLLQKEKLQQSSLELLPKNIELEALYGAYKESQYKNGGSVGLRIPIRLTTKKIEKIVASKNKIAQIDMQLFIAYFKKELQLRYTKYVYQKKLFKLIQKEKKLIKRLIAITQKKYKNGYATKIELLRTKLLLKKLHKKELEQQKKLQQALYDIYSYTGIQEPVTSSSFLYSDVTFQKLHNAKLKLLKQKSALFLDIANFHTTPIQRIDFVAEYEKEPDQEIIRAGIAFALPLFHQNQEKKRLYLLKARRAQKEYEALVQALRFRLQSLYKQAQNMQKELTLLRSIQKEQQELLQLYLQSYAISKTSLFDILKLKNELLDTQREYYTKMMQLNFTIIKIRYIQGEYDE